MPAISEDGKEFLEQLVANGGMWISLHYADPAGTAGSYELAGGGYARRLPVWNTPSLNVLSQSGSSTFDKLASQNALFFGLWSAASGGTFVTSGALPIASTANSTTHTIALKGEVLDAAAGIYVVAGVTSVNGQVGPVVVIPTGITVVGAAPAYGKSSIKFNVATGAYNHGKQTFDLVDDYGADPGVAGAFGADCSALLTTAINNCRAFGGGTIRMEGKFTSSGATRHRITGNVFLDMTGGELKYTHIDGGMDWGHNQNQVQTVTGTGTGLTTYTLTYGGQTTTAIAAAAAAGTVQAALEALSNLVPGDVTVTGGPVSTTPLVITFNFTTDATAVTATPTGGTAVLTVTQRGGDFTTGGARHVSLHGGNSTRNLLNIGWVLGWSINGLDVHNSGYDAANIGGSWGVIMQLGQNCNIVDFEVEHCQGGGISFRRGTGGHSITRMRVGDNNRAAGAAMAHMEFTEAYSVAGDPFAGQPQAMEFFAGFVESPDDDQIVLVDMQSLAQSTYSVNHSGHRTTVAPFTHVKVGALCSRVNFSGAGFSGNGAADNVTGVYVVAGAADIYFSGIRSEFRSLQYAISAENLSTTAVHLLVKPYITSATTLKNGAGAHRILSLYNVRYNTLPAASAENRGETIITQTSTAATDNRFVSSKDELSAYGLVDLLDSGMAPDWAATTYYRKNMLFVEPVSGQLRRATASHVSGATYTTANSALVATRATPQVVAYAATIIIDSAVVDAARVTLTGNPTINGPTNPRDGQSMMIEMLASAAARTITLATGTGHWIHTLAVPASPALTVASGFTGFLAGRYSTSTARWHALAFEAGA